MAGTRRGGQPSLRLASDPWASSAGVPQDRPSFASDRRMVGQYESGGCVSVEDVSMCEVENWIIRGNMGVCRVVQIKTIESPWVGNDQGNPQLW